MIALKLHHILKIQIMLCVCFLLAAINANTQKRQTLLPAPQKITYKEGRINIKNIALFHGVKDSAEVFALKQFALKLQEQTGIKIKNAVSQTASVLKYSIKKQDLTSLLITLIYQARKGNPIKLKLVVIK